MEYECFNCENLIELPEVSHNPDESENCPNCFANLNLDIYIKCKNCSIHFIKSMRECPNCFYQSNTLIKIPEIKFNYVKTEREYAESIYFFEAEKVLAVDTEGNGLDPFTLELFLIQIGTSEKVYVFNFDWHKKLAKEKFWNNKFKTFIMHNAKFDYKILHHQLKIDIHNIFDTFLAERILTCGLERKNSLKEVVKKYLYYEMDKEIRDDFINLNKLNFKTNVSSSMIKYSALDVQLLPIIHNNQLWELKNANLMEVAKLEFEVCKVVAKMELRGIYVDIIAWRKIIDKCQVAKDDIEDKIHNLLIDSGFNGGLSGELKINLNSTKDLKLVFNKFGIKIDSTGDDELSQINHPFAALLREYRKYEKQLSSFGESFLELVKKDTSRVHPSFQQIGADTGRFSCNNPNLQQIPAGEEYRMCFAAPPGRKIVACDYSQQELRLLASLSKDPKFIKFYEDDIDLHSATASMMFNIPIEKVEKNTHRKVAKTINFGLAYGQGAKKLGITIGVTEKEAESMIEKYFSQFTYIKDWLDKVANDAKNLGYSKTLLGRKRFYNIPEKYNPEYKQIMSSIGRQGKNTPIQGSGVDMIKMAMVLIENRLAEAKIDAYLINVVHDELIIEASATDAIKASVIVKEAMIEAGKKLAPNVPILAEEGIGDFWKH